MSTQLITDVPRTRVRRSWRVRTLSGLGPATVVAGSVWAVLQPYRLTLLHPSGQGFWWLFAEPPLFVIAVGLLFHFLLVPGLVADVEADEG